ncbi:MAG: TonB-dependent receptor plug domain-containing protein [Bacteroidales bacterium]|jgi:iron complex outermembrane receptor protein|nr:TonB-dependent receptor plug domain-containing protein [Bacteroidales bacterium]
MRKNIHIPLFCFYKKEIITVFLIFFICIRNVDAQNIPDTIYLPEFEVITNYIQEKETAGMKKSKVDSIVMKEKINVSLSELLSENTTVFIKNHGRGALATASFRGTAASHTQVTWNGMNINSPMTGMVDFSLIPVYLIDDLNLKYGAASITDNSGGLGGSINISNTADWNNRFNLKYLQGLGSYSTFDEFLHIGWGKSNIQLKTRIYHNYSKNNYTYLNRSIINYNPETNTYENPIDTNNNADYTRYGLLQEIYFKPNERNVISVKYWFQDADRTIPRATSYEGPDNSNLNNQNDIHHKVVSDWSRYGEKSKLHLQSGYYYQNLLYNLINNVIGVGYIPAIYSKSHQQGFVNKVSYNYDFREDFSIEAVLNANYFTVNSIDTVKNIGYEGDRAEFSALIGLRKSFWKRLNLNLILKQEIVDSKFSPFVPFFGFNYKLLKNKTLFIKGNISRNYHLPSLNDLYWQPGGNPDLLPENGFSFELGVELISHHSEKIKIQSEITYFRNDINNWIIWLPSYRGYWEPMNISKVLSQGFEVDLKVTGKLRKLNYKITGSYAYTSSKNYGDALVWGDESYGKQLVYIPLHSGNVLVNFEYRGFYITYQHNSYSERFTTSSNDVSKRDWLYPYFMNDLFFGKDFSWDKISLSIEFKIYNLFNETYHSILYRPMPKRNYMLQILFKYN